MKKIISIIMCMALLASMAVGLSSCAGEKEAGAQTLTWYMFGDKPVDHDMVMAEANKIIQEEIGVTLDMQYIDSASYAEKMKLKMASGEAFDLLWTGYAFAYANAVDMGGLYDITDIAKDIKLEEVIPQYYLDSASIDGRFYGIPNIQVISNPYCISIAKTLAEQIGVDAEAMSEMAYNVKTADDYKAYLDALGEVFGKAKAAQPDKRTYKPHTTQLLETVYEVMGGGIAIKKDGTSDTFVNLAKTEEAKYMAQKQYEWYKAGYIRQDIASANEDTSNETKRTYSTHQGSWTVGTSPKNDLKTYGEEQVYMMLHKPYVSQQRALATMTSVSATSKNPEKSVELLKLVNSNKDLYNLICWGIEGTHYTKNEDGTVKEIEGSGYAGTGAKAWLYGNQFNSLVAEGQPAGVWQQIEQMNNEAVKSPILGFFPDTTMITTEIANVANVNAEYNARLWGTEDPAQWYDEYVQELDNAGIEKILAEYQKQYDEWKALVK